MSNRHLVMDAGAGVKVSRLGQNVGIVNRLSTPDMLLQG
jgi:hypothetical protein